MARTNMSVARVERLSSANVGKTERHNERKNQTYENVNVVPERIPYNVSFKSPGDKTYNEYFDQLVVDGKISTRGLKDGATLFNEMVIDINTMYFEEHGGYEFAKEFYGEAYRFACKIYGEDQIISAVMHADEINKAASEELGKPVYHYHLHVDHMSSAGFRDFQRGERGSTAEHLSSLDYQIRQDEQRLAQSEEKIAASENKLQEIEQNTAEATKKLQKVKIQYDKEHRAYMTYSELGSLGKKGITGKVRLAENAKESYETKLRWIIEKAAMASFVKEERKGAWLLLKGSRLP